MATKKVIKTSTEDGNYSVRVLRPPEIPIQMIRKFEACERVPPPPSQAKNSSEFLKDQLMAEGRLDGQALYEKGREYLYGEVKDEGKAVEYFQLAAKGGDSSDAMCALASFYRDGVGVAQDTNYAVDLLRRAADLNNPTALYHLGNCYLHGDILEQNDELGLIYLENAAKLNSMEAQVALSIYYRTRSARADRMSVSRKYGKLAHDQLKDNYS